MGIIGEVQIRACYEAAVNSLRSGKSYLSLADEASERTGISVSSARIYISSIMSMVRNANLERDINSLARKKILEWVNEDLEEQALRNVLEAFCSRDAWLRCHGYSHGGYLRAMKEFFEDESEAFDSE